MLVFSAEGDFIAIKIGKKVDVGEVSFIIDLFDTCIVTCNSKLTKNYCILKESKNKNINFLIPGYTAGWTASNHQVYGKEQKRKGLCMA